MSHASGRRTLLQGARTCLTPLAACAWPARAIRGCLQVAQQQRRCSWRASLRLLPVMSAWAEALHEHADSRTPAWVPAMHARGTSTSAPYPMANWHWLLRFLLGCGRLWRTGGVPPARQRMRGSPRGWQRRRRPRGQWWRTCTCSGPAGRRMSRSAPGLRAGMACARARSDQGDGSEQANMHAVRQAPPGARCLCLAARQPCLPQESRRPKESQIIRLRGLQASPWSFISATPASEAGTRHPAGADLRAWPSAAQSWPARARTWPRTRAGPRRRAPGRRTRARPACARPSPCAAAAAPGRLARRGAREQRPGRLGRSTCLCSPRGRATRLHLWAPSASVPRMHQTGNPPVRWRQRKTVTATRLSSPTPPSVLATRGGRAASARGQHGRTEARGGGAHLVERAAELRRRAYVRGLRAEYVQPHNVHACAPSARQAILHALTHS